jgi:biotin carboxyl carrier protein
MTRKQRRVIHFLSVRESESRGENGTVSGVTDFGINPEDVRRLARLVEQNGLSELRYEEGDLRITLRTAAFPRPSAPPDASALASDVQREALLDEEEEFDDSFVPAIDTDDKADLLRVEAPLMGVFYRALDKDAPPFIEVGDIVEVGQVVGLIEAMKVFSEVPSEIAGRVRDIPARNGALVQPGDPLVILEALD